MQERAVTIDNTNADYVTELGFELLLQGRVRDAMKCYRNAMKLDETSVAALTGQIFYLLHLGMSKSNNNVTYFHILSL